MAILCFSGGIIFMLPYLREVYYQPMQAAFGYDNTQMGILMSVFGAFSLIAYFPGGWLSLPGWCWMTGLLNRAYTID